MRNCIPGYELQYMIIGTVIDFTKNYSVNFYHRTVNPLNAELNPICHLLALLGVHHFLHVSKIRVNACVFCTVTGLQFNIPSTDVIKPIKYEMERTCYIHKRYEKYKQNIVILS